MNKETIIVDGLTKQFKNILAVNNISFKIGKGKIIGLLGPNGCGKSTTIGMMLGLIKPSSGTVIINGQNIEQNRTDLLEKMNFISPYVELPKKLTVEENLKVYGRLYGVKNLKDKIYDLFINIKYNFSPVIKEKGSAIFLHITDDKYKPTEGCVAIAKKDFLKILPLINNKTKISIG